METISGELHSLLSEFHKIGVVELRSVRHVLADGGLDKILLKFDEVSLLVEAESEFDSILFRVVNNDGFGDFSGVDVSHEIPWSQFIGKKFGWGWVVINQQNYLDGILLSFDLIDPNLLLYVMASSICISEISQISRGSDMVP